MTGRRWLAVYAVAAIALIWGGLLPPLLVVVGIATVVVPANVLDAIGAYPTLRSFHDAVNAVAAPAGWALLVSLVVLAIAGLAPASVGTAERTAR